MTLHLIYPRQTLENSNAFLTFRAYDYSSAPQIGAGNIRSAVQRSAGGLASGTTLKDAGKDIKNAFNSGSTAGEGDATGIGAVSLYLPQNLEYSYGANWKGIQFGALGAAFQKGQTLGTTFTQAAKVGGVTGASVLGDMMGDALSVVPKTQGLDTDSVLGAAFGITFNDNTLQTFEKMETRTFDFKFIMVARDAAEELEIKQIIKFFKVAMHPDSTSNGKNNTIFLKYPYIFRIIPAGYKNTTTQRSGNNFRNTISSQNYSSFLPNTRYCGLKGMSVSYTPNNVVSLTPNNFVTAVSLSLSFIELTNLTRKDIVDVEDATELSGYTGRDTMNNKPDQLGPNLINSGTGRDGTFGEGTSGFGMPSNPPLRANPSQRNFGSGRDGTFGAGTFGRGRPSG